MSQAAHITGTVKFFKPVDGYGFLVRDDDKTDVFVHSVDLKKSGVLWIQSGAKMIFDIVDSGRGPRAVNLRGIL